MNTKQFSRGLRVGVPISLGYLAVSFTLGITAKNAGLSAFQATLTSLLVNASAGQYAAFTMMAAQGGYWEIAILEAVTNARYILMSCALSQKLPAASKLWHRLVIGFNVNDEIFGMAIAEQGKLNPFYYFGMMTVAMPGWALGTFLGTSVGNVLPANVVSALSVGLYGMFLAVIIPASRKSKVILGVVVVSMAASFALECIPLFASLASGTRIILLTVVIAAGAALLFPVKAMEHNVYLYIAVVALVTYLIRVLPLTLIRREIKNPFLRSFLYYVPYVTLAAMTFPAILHATDSLWSGLAALVAGVLVAWFSGNLFLVAASGCVVVFLVELLL